MSPILSGLGGITVKGYGHFGPVRVTDTGAMFALQNITLGTAGSTVDTVTFRNIPQTYSHLQLRINGNQNAWYLARFNGVSTNGAYRSLEMRGTGSGTLVSDMANFNTTWAWLGIGAGSVQPTFIVADLLDYSNTNKNKAVRSVSGADDNSSGKVSLTGTQFFSNNAITQIEIFNQGGALGAYSSFALYGIKAA